ncbi:MmyB family transcriptional regulator [Streptomyces nigra]|uniref:MmyB family transcriptional regulator n=1 Tax=Streptomyces nigra TaxID=1827580 RepID=UPI0035E12440
MLGAGRERWARGSVDEAQARDITAYLRHVAAHHPADQDLHALIHELSVRSADCSRIWSGHPVSVCLASRREYRRPRSASYG